MKRNLLLLCLAVCLLVGCSKKASYVNTHQDSPQFVPGEDARMYNDFGSGSTCLFTQGNAGYYYCDTATRLLRYYEPETKQSVPLCAQPNCSHDSADCNAYLDYWLSVYRLQFYYGYLYLVGSGKENRMDVCVYRIHPDGSVREQVGTLFSLEGNAHPDYVIHRGYLYCVLVSASAGKEGIRLYRFCLDGSTQAQVVYTADSHTGSRISLRASGNYLYLHETHPTSRSYTGSILRYQIHTGETETLCREVWRCYTLSDTTLYYDNGTQIIAHDLDSGQETPVAEPGIPVYLACYGTYLVYDNGCGLWLNGGTDAQRTLTLWDAKTRQTLSVISLPQPFSEFIGLDDTALFAMIPKKQPDSNAYDPQFCLCPMDSALQGTAEFLPLSSA